MRADPPPVVAEEVAAAEFERMLEAMDLEVAPEDMDDDDRAGFDVLRTKIIRAMMAGTLVVDPDGQPVFTPSDGGKPIKFQTATGAALMAMDEKKAGHAIAKSYAILAVLTKQPIARFTAMRIRDVRICIAIANLFLADPS